MFLNRIIEVKKTEVESLKTVRSISDFEKQIADMPRCRGFIESLNKPNNGKMGLIAEVKKASPSKGLIREDFEPVGLAKTYEQAGADCISVLTDVQFFQGSNDYLTAIKKEVSLPLLRKDFVIDPIQIYEARAIGADAVLLIAAALEKQQLKQFMDISASLGLDVLFEVHNEAELEIALELDAELIGINNRNLHTFVTDLAVTEQLMAQIPNEKTVISESGIAAREDVDRVAKAGARGLLIGEHFMRQPDVAAAVRQLMTVQ